MNQDDPTWKTTLPFPRRWLYYLVLKICVVAVAVMAVLRIMGYV